MTNTGFANQKMPNTGKWQDSHDKAWQGAIIPGNFPPRNESEGKAHTERAMVSMLKGWAAYATGHRAQHGSMIGDDGFLGPLWLEMGKSLRGLLNGEIGRMDGGTVDSFIIETLEANGFTQADL